MSIRGVRIKIHELSHRYTPKSPVTFDNVNLDAKQGEIIVIIGRSGCGKSTLLHILAGLLRPTDGTVYLDKILVAAPSPQWVMPVPGTPSFSLDEGVAKCWYWSSFCRVE
ncbi:MAG: ATP-binding cassette domain-containing protein [Candidatus Thiodiazotropha sp. (ex Rostrolucina anterorostrata)]|nr:ATP-binding cassette domain-containing protein [Candidatus Thiodiazotropha sp. (ex Rostrolucina anterorostrata)]